MVQAQISQFLFEAIANYDDNQLLNVLIQCGDPDETNDVGLPPIVAAAAIGNTEGMKYIYQAGANPSAVNRFGGTILLPSSEKGHSAVVREGIQWGVDVNHVNRLGWTALQEALILGNDSELYQLIVYMLDHAGASWKLRDFDGKSALDWLGYKHDSFSHIYSGNLPVLKQMYFHAYFHKQDIESKLPRNKKSWSSIDYFMAFIDAYDTNRYPYALTICQEARNHVPDEQQADYIFYEFLVRKRWKGWPDAHVFIKRFPDLLHHNDFFTYHYSNFLREGNQHHAAIKVMEELVDRFPKRTDYLFHLANSLFQVGQIAEGKRTMSQAALIQPENTLFHL